MKGLTPICGYCNKFSKMVKGSVIYPHINKLHHLDIYHCSDCDAYVGCHKGTTKPLGRLANAELRKAKVKAHNCFDDIWKDGHMKRGEAYSWLADKLGIKKSDCHIGMFSVEQCESVAYHSCGYINSKLSFL